MYFTRNAEVKSIAGAVDICCIAESVFNQPSGCNAPILSAVCIQVVMYLFNHLYQTSSQIYYQTSPLFDDAKTRCAQVWTQLKTFINSTKEKSQVS